tara:strand:- start:204 stop:374 length:171 start_codon:yes stop_codon:yes gene_type:complete
LINSKDIEQDWIVLCLFHLKSKIWVIGSGKELFTMQAQYLLWHVIDAINATTDLQT